MKASEFTNEDRVKLSKLPPQVGPYKGKITSQFKPGDTVFVNTDKYTSSGGKVVRIGNTMIHVKLPDGEIAAFVPEEVFATREEAAPLPAFGKTVKEDVADVRSKIEQTLEKLERRLKFA